MDNQSKSTITQVCRKCHDREVLPGEGLHVSDGVRQRHSIALRQQETQQP